MKKKRWRRILALDPQTGTPRPEPEPTAVVRDTGSARASREGKAVTEHHAAAPRRPFPAVEAPTQVSGTGNATASGGGIANSGILTYVQPRREPVTFPHQVGVVPARAGCFQDRAAASAVRQAVVCQVLAGMGGVGKTQLAADQARHAWRNEEVDLLVWVTAATRNAVINAYTQAAVDILCADPGDPERAAKAFLAWLEPKTAQQTPRWLIVLDDVADPGDLDDLWPPAHACGRTLVTTRRRDASLATHGHLVPVALFTPAEATAYLHQALAAHGRRESAVDLAALAADLGHLPLALSQAAAYLTDTHLDATTYRTRLADRARQLPDLLPESGTLPDSQPTTVAAAWSLSLDRADQLRPAGLARPMLQLASMLDPNGISHEVLTSDPALAHLAAHRTAPGSDSPAPEPSAVSAEEATGALRALHRLSLIDHILNTPHQAVRVHQLIQRTMRDRLPADLCNQFARTAADALLAAWPDIERDTALAQSLRANTDALTRHAEDALWGPDRHHSVLSRAGQSLGRSGKVRAAATHYQRLADTARLYLGPDHPDTLGALHCLALWRGNAGDVAGAAEVYAMLLPDLVRVLGPDHFDTLLARRNLAACRANAGDAAGAVAALAELLPDLVRVLGPDDPATLSARYNLASSRGKAGDAAGAVAALAELATDSERVLGPDHPDTLSTRHNLTIWRGEAEDPASAVMAFAELLEHKQRVLGPDHPGTLRARQDLADWQGKAGNPASAVTALAELLPDQVRVLGPDHPDTLSTRHELAFWCGQSGDPAGAAQATAELVPDRERVLGPDHPDTLSTRQNLAFWCGQSGDPAGAAQATTGLLTDLVRVLGPDHHQVLAARSNLASWCGQVGDPAGAVAAFTGLLHDLVRVLGPDHPDTVDARSNLASWRSDASDAAEDIR
ncbi:tetratricopeptide repeat protein [Streptomyces chartreusis]|uniref:tetratricopeptide repeat protein n=1 Tax=Streptomyces chartreusis TaxID=1969 RepID=UPI001C3FACA5|nr:tetratricopeptide repeat protein [Streptomyces chartreusis]